MEDIEWWTVLVAVVLSGILSAAVAYLVTRNTERLRGDMGPAGIQGPPGRVGLKGDRGPRGPRGASALPKTKKGKSS